MNGTERWKRWVCAALCALLLLPQAARAEETAENDGDAIYTMVDENGRSLMRRAGRIYVGDGLIAGDNSEYLVTAVDDEHGIAYAERVEQSEQTSALPVLGTSMQQKAVQAEDAVENAADSAAQAGRNAADTAEDTKGAAQSAEEAVGADGERLICLYCTHSDESYEPTDGEYSMEKDAGIYDVSEAFAQSLEALGITVRRSEETFLPHDSGAYRRSRATAAEYAKLTPSAIFDIHRDGIPDATEYEETVDGEEIAQVRLLVGRSNENSQVNKEFAKQIKAVADEKYPGLIRDIFIGKGNYNQELYPQALLLEFGTYSNDKELVLKSTDMMADAVSTALYGAGQSTTQRQQAQDESNKGAVKGVAWTVGILVGAALLYALISTGTLKNLGQKISSGAGELTGGLFGGRKRDDDEH